MVQYLGECGYEVDGALKAKDALALLEKGSYDLIITDIVMPDMDGIETILKIRKQDKDVPIIAMSGGGRISHEDYLTLASQLGANTTLAKPFQLSTLTATIEEIIR